MQTQLADFIKNTPKGQQADGILRNCVHCGFCNAVCPTYQVLGDELDGPRGRIYLIKQLLEGKDCAASVQLHLDRCLTCRACEAACPSGVQYSSLLDIGREVAETLGRRPWDRRMLRWLLLYWLPYPQRFAKLIKLAHTLRFLLPSGLKAKFLPRSAAVAARAATKHARKMLLLEGCVQPSLAPSINAAAVQVFDRLGIALLPLESAGCCGALSYHLNDQSGGLDMMRRVIDACWPMVESGVEAIVITASGCGVTLKEYGELLQHDVQYATKAARISALAKDIVEILQAEDLSVLRIKPRRVAFQAPCTLQHGLRLSGVVEMLLTRLGFTLTPVTDAHLCCGSAGSYSILQPRLAGCLRDDKLSALLAGNPEVIASANIGCCVHLQEKSTVPVLHWIELLGN